MTDLQVAYDSFFSKTDRVYTGQEGVVFDYLKSALIYIEFGVEIELPYTLTDPVTYEGFFNEDVADREIEYIGKIMILEEARRGRVRLSNKADQLGTKDFYYKEGNKGKMEAAVNNQRQAKEDVVDYEETYYYYYV